MGTSLKEQQTMISGLAAALIGVIGWSGQAATLPLSFVFLLLVTVQANRWAAFSVALSYYAGSSWPLVPGAKAFFGPNFSFSQGTMLWLIASVLLATPWGLFHFRTWPARFCSVPLALAATSIPPLGLIGWASPLTCAGMLFPGTAWAGIIGAFCLPAVIVRYPRRGLLTTVALIAGARSIYPGDPVAPRGWEAVDTAFGRSELEVPDPVREFRNAEWIEQRALHSRSKVIVFPETVVPRWNEATEAFWQPTLSVLAARGTTIIFGSTIPVAASERRLNSIVIRGANVSASFTQHVPPPISMWNPLSRVGFPLRLTGPGTVRIADERAGILICYELLLTWPVLSTSWENPTILVGVANDYWADQKPIPAVQRIALDAWARLFSLPRLLAVNT
jgi:hypothetical protein